MIKKVTIVIPEGYEIDLEASELSKGEIVFKKIQPKFIEGFYIDPCGNIGSWSSKHTLQDACQLDACIFRTKEMAKSAVAAAKISQIMALDERFGGPITAEEWDNSDTTKYVIDRKGNCTFSTTYDHFWAFLAFHTREQRDLFFEEHRKLVLDYLMVTK